MIETNVLYKMLDTLPERICLLEVSGQILYANRAWVSYAKEHGCERETNIIGYSYFELECHKTTDCTHYKELRKKIAEVLSGQKTGFSLEYAEKNGNHTKWFLLTATWLENENSLMLSQSDITDRIIAQKALEKNENKYLKLLQITSEGFWQIDLDKKTIAVNDSLCEMLGYSREEMLGITPLEFADEENQRIFKEQTSKITTSQHRAYEICLQHKSGQPVFTIFNATTYLGDNNEALGSFAFVTDISEQKRIESELKDTNNFLMERVNDEMSKQMKILEEKKQHEALLMQQSKMADMGEMIGVIAHQWKQPLNTIQLASNVIEDMVELEMYDAEKTEEFCGIIANQTKYMSETIEEFRNFFKPGKQKECFFVCKAAISAFNILKPKFLRSSIEFILHEHEHENEHFEVMGYPGEYKQVIINLLNNAHDAITASGADEGVVQIDFKRHDNSGDIIISDTGGGIPEDLLPDKLFDAYVTSKGDDGTGIGLYLAKLIIEEKMGGSLQVHNSENGAIFTISLPLVNKGASK